MSRTQFGHTLEYRIEETISRDLRRGRRPESNPTLVLEDPSSYLNQDLLDPPSAEEEWQDYERMLAAFLGCSAGRAVALDWLVALAIKGGPNRRLAISSYLTSVVDHPEFFHEQPLPETGDLTRWASLLLDHAIEPPPSELRGLIAAYLADTHQADAF